MLSDRLEANLLNCLGLFLLHHPRKYAQFLGPATKHSNGSAAAVALGGWSMHVDAGVKLSETLFLCLSLFVIFSYKKIRRGCSKVNMHQFIHDLCMICGLSGKPAKSHLISPIIHGHPLKLLCGYYHTLVGTGPPVPARKGL
jgi:hypothetical protein